MGSTRACRRRSGRWRCHAYSSSPGHSPSQIHAERRHGLARRARARRPTWPTPSLPTAFARPSAQT
eukprot:2030977-Pleurochrysis_carterae.AAC.1